MEIIRDLRGIPYMNRAALSIGVFDGVHLGHKKILSSMSFLSKGDNKKKYFLCVLTFQNHPEWLKNREIIFPKLILPPHYKLEIFEKEFNIDKVFYIKFSTEFMKITAEEFIMFLKSRINDLHIFVGYNFRFGYMGKGDTDLLVANAKKYDYFPHIIDEVFVEGLRVSSSAIRRYISEGEIELANKLLGRKFFLESRVIRGKGKGTKIGFPTANIRSKYQVYPPRGIYGTITEVDGKMYKSVTHVGFSPTFGGNDFDVETHIIEFDKDIYKKPIRVYFGKFLGYSKVLDNISALKDVIGYYVETWMKTNVDLEFSF